VRGGAGLIAGRFAANQAAKASALAATALAADAIEEAASSGPLRGWIAQSLYRRLASPTTNNALRMAFERALSRGAAANVGEEGIKKLAGSGINGYQHELKILGQGLGRWRLLGNLEQVSIPVKGGGMRKISVVVFRQLIQH
jgi:hypothetical protein